MSRLRLIPVLFILTLGSSACQFGFKKKKTARVFVPPPIARTAPKPLPSQPLIPDGPVIDAKVTYDPTVEYPASIPVVPPPPAPVKRPVPTPPKVVQTPPQPESIPQPRLGQIFTAEQLRDYNKTLEESLDRVRKTLAVIERKSLTAAQVETVERIRTFQKQAEQAREQDLVTAVNLARRADVLAQDLVQRLP
jgi:hypothetical protein